MLVKGATAMYKRLSFANEAMSKIDKLNGVPKAVHRMIYSYFKNTEATDLKSISFCMLR